MREEKHISEEVHMQSTRKRKRRRLSNPINPIDEGCSRRPLNV
jgi:hypothetical protein